MRHDKRKNKMNALINLEECKEYMTITVNNVQYQIRLAGTVDDPYFCGKDVCDVLGYEAGHKLALQKFVDDDDKTTIRNLKNIVI